MEHDDNEYMGDSPVPSPEELEEQYDMSAGFMTEEEAELFLLGIEKERAKIRIRETVVKSVSIGIVVFMVGFVLIGWTALCYWLAI